MGSIYALVHLRKTSGGSVCGHYRPGGYAKLVDDLDEVECSHCLRITDAERRHHPRRAPLLDRLRWLRARGVRSVSELAERAGCTRRRVAQIMVEQGW